MFSPGDEALLASSDPPLGLDRKSLQGIDFGALQSHHIRLPVDGGN